MLEFPLGKSCVSHFRAHLGRQAEAAALHGSKRQLRRSPQMPRGQYSGQTSKCEC